MLQKLKYVVVIIIPAYILEWIIEWITDHPGYIRAGLEFITSGLIWLFQELILRLFVEGIYVNFIQPIFN